MKLKESWSQDGNTFVIQGAHHMSGQLKEARLTLQLLVEMHVNVLSCLCELHLVF